MIAPLPNKIVTSIIKQYNTDGHSPYLVLTSDFEKYVLKTLNTIQDKSSLTKEFLCDSFLRHWGLHLPNIATLKLCDELIHSPSLNLNIRFSYSNFYFGSELQPDAIDLHLLISANGKVPFRKILNPSDLLKIALFDIWIENDDRKPSNNNLLLCPHNKGLFITPIDHAFTFASMNLNQLNPEFVSFSDNDSIIYSPLGHSIIRNLKINSKWLSQSKENFYICISKIEDNFQHICDYLPPEFHLANNEKDSLHAFLFNEKRNKEVFEQFKYILSTYK